MTVTTRHSDTPVTRPATATHPLVATTGVVFLALGVLLLRQYHPLGNNIVYSALFLVGLTAISIFSVDLLWQKVHRRESSGLQFASWTPSVRRCAIKMAGLLASMGLIAVLYWIFPEYHGPLYTHYFQLLQVIVPVWIVAAVPYFYYVDARMVTPQDGYWQMGKLVSLQFSEINATMLGQHVLGWLIKGFFLPLMFTYMYDDLVRLMARNGTDGWSFDFTFWLIFDLCYFIDVSLVTMGYLMSLRVTDTHLRSAEPTMLGWVVALCCYDPFWIVIGSHFLAYELPFKWGNWLTNYPLIYSFWGYSILLLTTIYVWSTISFGARFSNLTHRGIITNGPYRFTKHPAYIAKNLSWWLISVPFIAGHTSEESWRHCLLLLCFNGIYVLRAVTEERHLSKDPIYRDYAAWIDRHGIFRRIPAILRRVKP